MQLILIIDPKRLTIPVRSSSNGLAVFDIHSCNPGSSNTHYLVSVTKTYSVVDTSAPTKLGKLKVKKDSSQLTDRIPVTILSRVEFITRFLKVHDLDAKYAPGPHNGPTFKIYWSGLYVLFPILHVCP